MNAVTKNSKAQRDLEGDLVAKSLKQGLFALLTLSRSKAYGAARRPDGL
jgi:hypothetical protein